MVHAAPHCMVAVRLLEPELDAGCARVQADTYPRPGQPPSRSTG